MEESEGEETVAAEVPLEIARGRALVDQFYLGELEKLRERFTPAFAEQMSLEAFAEMRRNVTLQLGSETEVLDERLGNLPDSILYVRWPGSSRPCRSVGRTATAIPRGSGSARSATPERGISTDASSSGREPKF